MAKAHTATNDFIGGSPCKSDKGGRVIVRVVRMCIRKLVALQLGVQVACSYLVDDGKVFGVQVNPSLCAELVLSSCNRKPGRHGARGTCA